MPTPYVQLALNVLLSASVWLLVGLGFSLVYRTAKFFHFAHGVVFTYGAYFAFLFVAHVGIPLVLSCFLAVGLGALMGISMELAVYRVLRHSNASPLVLLLASLGIYVALQNVISLIFGDETQTMRTGAVREGMAILGGRLTPIQLILVVTTLVLVGVVAFVLARTRMGRSIRAVASDQYLARVSGIDCDMVILYTLAIGSALAATAGILVALDVDMAPTMGLNALLMGVVVVLISGLGSLPGMILGATFLGVVQHLSAWTLGSQWQDTAAFSVLVGFLLLNPYGSLRQGGKRTVLR